jgi:hypothetical protein
MRFLNPFPLVFLIFIVLSFCTVQSFRLQGVGVKGQLLCKGSYSVHTSVAIFDVDRNPGDPDVKLFKIDSRRIYKYFDVNNIQKAELNDGANRRIYSENRRIYLEIGGSGFIFKTSGIIKNLVNQAELLKT